MSPSDRTGRLSLNELLAEPRPGTAIYACGPAGFLDAVSAECARWPDGALHIERFHTSGRSESQARSDVEEPPGTGSGDKPIEVSCRRSGRTVFVPAERSILAALLDAGIPVESSCREGLCGTCETRVLDGVPDHRDEILDDGERHQADVMYLCVSRARTPHLVLDV
jgi:ferredoxin